MKLSGGIVMITVNFGKRVKQLRNLKGLSQEKFALLIDVDRTYFASVESGKRNVSLVNIKKIADGLGVTLSELLEGVE
jgi:transcriptional regulator with XRE-family HTH domain